MITRVVFMGSGAFAAPIFRQLAAHAHNSDPPLEVVGLVTQPDRPAGRGRKTIPGVTKLIALDAGIPVLQPERLRASDGLESVLALAPDLIVVASFGQILPRRLVELPRYGSLNLHPSLLPRLRGPSPVAGAILGGDSVTGTTLMLMNERMDEGPIVAQETLPIGPDETSGELEIRLAEASATMLIGELPAWLQGSSRARPQDPSLATYTSLLTKEDGIIRWTEPASTVASRVRAFNPWPAASTTWNGRHLRILRAAHRPGTGEPGRVLGLVGGALAVAAGSGVVAANELQLAGSRPLGALQFVRGHGSIIGSSLGEP